MNSALEEQFLSIVSQHGVARRAWELLGLARSAIAFRRRQYRLATHLRGLPLVPRNFVWPAVHGRHPMSLVATVELAEIHPLCADVERPSFGRLLFFAHEGSNIRSGALGCVRFVQDPPSACVPFAMPPSTLARPRPAFSISINETFTLPPLEDARVSSLGLSRSEREAYVSLLGDLYRCVDTGVHMFGDPTGMTVSKVFAGGTERVLLLQLASRTHGNFRWPRNATLHYTISPTALAAGHFDDVGVFL